MNTCLAADKFGVMTEPTQARREALRAFVRDNGGHARVVEKFKLTPSQASYLSQLITENSVAAFGERSAINWEDRFKIRDKRIVNAGLRGAESGDLNQTISIKKVVGFAAPGATSIEESLWNIANSASKVDDPVRRKDIAELVRMIVANPAENAVDQIPIVVRRLSGELPDSESLPRASNG